MAYGILTDLTRCIGCEACAFACKQINGLEGDPNDRLDATTWTTVDQRAGLNVRRQCMHCSDPTCVSVCPVGALQKQAEGPVTYDESRCIGCRYCMQACPFQIPTYEWGEQVPLVRKCIMCFEQRVSKGRQPACTEACPTGATKFGERDELIREARQRIHEAPERYVDHIYGLEEAGGTSVLYLSSVPFEELGFPTDMAQEPYPRLTWEVLSKIPNIVSTGGLLMVGTWWIVNRRTKVRDGRWIDEGNDAEAPAESVSGNGHESGEEVNR